MYLISFPKILVQVRERKIVILVKYVLCCLNLTSQLQLGETFSVNKIQAEIVFLSKCIWQKLLVGDRIVTSLESTCKYISDVFVTLTLSERTFLQ